MLGKTRDVLQATVAKELIRKGRVTAAVVRGGLTPRGDGRVTMIAGRRTPDAGRRTPDAGRRTPDAGRRTPDAGRRTPDAGRRTPDAGRRTPDAGRRTPDAGRRTPDAGRREFVLRPGRGHEPTRRVTGPLSSAGLCA